MRLDFSQFHDLMHKPFTAACRARPGGWRRHVALWWAYMARPWVRTQTTCRLGRHEWCEDGGARNVYPVQACWFCDVER